MTVIGTVADSQELLAQVDTTRPDIVILDWELPGLPAVDLLSTLGGRDGGPGVIVLGGKPETEAVALAAGASAFVYQGHPPKRLLTVLRAIQLES